MKTSLEHLPEHKRQLIERITGLVCEGSPADMLVLFGSYARGDWVEDHETLYYSDYDLLVVVESPEVAADALLWGGLESKLTTLAKPCPINLIVHDIRQLNDEIRRGRYFFSDVVAEGITLFDNKRFSLAKIKALTPAERLEQRRYDLRYWFNSASGFWHGVEYYMRHQQWAHAAFSLHQAAERYYHSALLVFTGYKPRTHNLETLAEQTSPLHPSLHEALPRQSEADGYLFDLLKRAYIEARYSKAYRITSEELVELRSRVQKLAACVVDACRDELGTILSPADVGPLPQPPEVQDPHEIPAPPDDPSDTAALREWEQHIAWIVDDRARAEHEQGRELGKAEGREIGKAEGREIGKAEGREIGKAEGHERGLRQGRMDAIVAVCEVVGVELTPTRRQHLERAGLDELDQLLQTLRQTRSWGE